MPERISTRCLIGGAVCLLTLVSGCQGLLGYRPISIQAIDAETKKPILDAEVSVSYPVTRSPLAPAPCVGRTGPDGVVRLQAKPFGDEGITIGVNGTQYLPEEHFLSDQSVRAIELVHLFENVERRPPSVVVELYAKPNPTVELVAPPGFRGEVNVDLLVQEEASSTPGQRLFSVVVPTSGGVQVSGPPLLRHVLFPYFHVKFAEDGVPGSQAKDAEATLWMISESSRHFTFFVGSQAEYKNHYGIPSTIAGDTKPSSGKRGGGGSGGRGRGGRRGGQPTNSDAGPATQ
jgi:hypothetical protein